MTAIDAPKSGFRTILDRYALRKDPNDIVAQAKDPTRSLKKTLGALDLTLLGVGAIIGAGIFVLAGVGSLKAGPLIVLSFVVAGVVCALAGLAYSELASTIPTSGSAYAYAYSSAGETLAWTLGWALVLEYAVGAAAVAIGWTGNFAALLESAGAPLPAWATCGALAGPGCVANLPAFVLVLLITSILVIGSKESAKAAGVLVAIKVTVILFVIAAGFYFLVTDIGFGNWSVALPAPDPGAWYSALGSAGSVVGAAAIIFFAYIGFDAVSTTSEETKNPKRDLPIGILGSLAICTVLYILASSVLVGLVPWTALDPDLVGASESEARLAEPFGYAFEAQGLGWAATIIRVGAIVGLASVIMVMLLGAPRVFFALARDGLLPTSWSRVHPKFGTPYRTTIGTGVAVAAFAAFGTIGTLSQVTNIGTLFAFTMVCIGVIVLRYKNPELERPFKVPLSIGKFPILAAIGAVLCVGLMAALDTITQLAFFAWMGLGLVLYSIYGIRRSVLYRQSVGERVEGAAPTAAAAAAAPRAPRPRDGNPYEDVEIILEEYQTRGR